VDGQRGYSITELVIVVGLMGLLAAVAIPPMQAAVQRNKIITASELVGAQIRQARLSAITRNAPFRVRFDCPDAGAMRVLAVTGDASIDNSGDRCAMSQPNDGPAVYAPPGVTFGDATPPTLQINGRGQIGTVGGGSLPLNISVSYGDASRTLTVTATGRLITPTS
jgi:prepilin-type N-terminal cleavage/methylation domain-containing protein